jgi:hypothetical protein
MWHLSQNYTDKIMCCVAGIYKSHNLYWQQENIHLHISNEQRTCRKITRYAILIWGVDSTGIHIKWTWYGQMLWNGTCHRTYITHVLKWNLSQELIILSDII